MSAAFADGLPSLGGESEGKGLLELWDVDTLLLQVGVLTNKASGVELGSTSPVGVTASNS